MAMNESDGEPVVRRRMSIVRRETAAAAARLLESTIESYRCLATLCPKPVDASEREIKEFNAHHAACRSALAHIDRLIRIQQWAAGPAENESDASDSIALLAHARATLEDYPSEDE